MLDRPAPAATAAKLIAGIPCHVVLPEALREQFESRGPAPAAPDDRRRFPRVRCRSTDNRAAVQCQLTYPNLVRKADWSAAYVADISRSGLQVIHSEQLFPGERLRVVLLTGMDLVMEVIRCRRIDQACFSVGLRVKEDEEAAGLAD